MLLHCSFWMIILVTWKPEPKVHLKQSSELCLCENVCHVIMDNGQLRLSLITEIALGLFAESGPGCTIISLGLFAKHLKYTILLSWGWEKWKILWDCQINFMLEMMDRVFPILVIQWSVIWHWDNGDKKTIFLKYSKLFPPLRPIYFLSIRISRGVWL